MLASDRVLIPDDRFHVATGLHAVVDHALDHLRKSPFSILKAPLE